MRGRTYWLRALLTGSLSLGFALGGCSTRDHSNPLDPENPESGGEPQWLGALADDGAVDLGWQVFLYRDVEEVRIIDAVHATVLWSGGLQPETYRDEGLSNGVDRRYRIDLILTTGTTLNLPEVIATPGSAVPWIMDFGTGTVARLTPDGRGRRDFVNLGDASSVVADPDSAFALVVEFFGGRVRLLDREANTRWRVDDLVRPSGAMHRPNGWWVSDSGLGAVFQLDDAGRFGFADSSFTFPTDLAPADSGAIWVADRGGTVSRLVPDEGVAVSVPMTEPLAVGATGDGGVWAADLGRQTLVRLDATGNELRRLGGWERVEDLKPDPVVPAGVWVADRSGQRVVLLDGEGTLLQNLGYFPSPSSLAISPDGAEIWIADPTVGEVIRMTRDGLELTRSQGLGAPVSISIAFGPSY